MRALMCLIVAAALPLLEAHADPQVRATLNASPSNPYSNQVFTLTLTVESSGVNLGQHMGLAGLPDATLLHASQWREMNPDQIDEGGVTFQRRRFSCEARATTVSSLHMTPTAQVVVPTREQSFFGFTTVEIPHDVSMPPLDVTVRSLPPPDGSQTFSGAVGQFRMNVIPSATNIVLGDLIDLRIEITGVGHLEDAFPPVLIPSEHVKVYPPKPSSASEGLAFIQTVIPQQEVPNIAALTFTYFDPQQERYITTQAGPFPLSYHARNSVQTPQYVPHGEIDTVDNSNTVADGSASNRDVAAKLKTGDITVHHTVSARLAPSASSMVLFEIPADSRVRIIQTTLAWLLIESQARRGWIPADTTPTPKPD